MEMYCPNCMELVGAARCPKCGERRLREPKPDDLVLLASKDAIWAGVAGEILDDNGIEYLKKSLLGAAIQLYVGSGADVWSFYVRYSDLARARGLLDEFFTPPPDLEL